MVFLTRLGECTGFYLLKPLSKSGQRGIKMDNNGQGPESPIKALLEAAISMHEMYVNFVAAGFTEQQALYLVAQTLRPQNDN